MNGIVEYYVDNLTYKFVKQELFPLYIPDMILRRQMHLTRSLKRKRQRERKSAAGLVSLPSFEVNVGPV